MKKRPLSILASLLAVTMIFGVCAGTAYAADGQSDEIAWSTSFSVIQSELGSDNLFNEDGVAWLEVEDIDSSAEYNAVVNTNGTILYLSDPQDFGRSQACDVTTTAFIDGLAAVYVPGEPGFKIVDQTGEEVYESSDEDLYMCRYMKDGNFLLLKHELGFDHDDWIIYVLDSDLNLRSTEVKDSGSLYKNSITLLSDGIYRVQDMVLNTNDGFYAGLPGGYVFHNDSTMYLLTDDGLCTVPLETVLNAGSDGVTLDACTLVNDDVWTVTMTGEGCAMRDKDFIPFHDLSFFSSWYTDAGEYVKCIKDLNNEILVSYPIFNESVRILKCESFSGGYSALYMRGADENRYATVIDENGEMQYEPKQFAGPSFFDDFPSLSYHGYIFTYYMIITPDGTEKHVGDDLSALSDARFVREEPGDTSEGTYTGYGIAVGGGYIMQRDSDGVDIYSLDGKVMLDTFTAYFDSNGDLIHTDPGDGAIVLDTAADAVPSDAAQSAPVEKNYISVDDFSIEGKWKNVGNTTWGQVQAGAIVTFDGYNCNFFSPIDTYAFYKDGDNYKLDCTSLLADTISSTVKIVDENNIDIVRGSTVLEMTRVG